MAVKFEFWFAQTSHLVAFVCTLIVVVVLSTMQGVDLGSAGMFTMLVRTAHLASFGTWLGAQVWVTFFAGLTMYQYLPRHIFGYIQSKLFPKYFTLGLILSTVTVVTFVIENPIATWGFQEKLQGGFLLLSLMVVLANMIYFTPVSTTTMFEKHKLEKEEHAGEAVGKIEDDKAVKLRKNPRYVELETKFRLLHTLASIANLLSLSAQAVHLWYLAGHLQDL